MATNEQIPQLTFHTPSKQDNEQKNRYSQTPQSRNNRSTPQQKSPKSKIINNYILGQKIGQGTFNQVKIARHILTNEKVAIKIIDKASILTLADKRRLQLELKILRKVRHPNIAQLYEILEDKNHLFLVTEHASRGELFDHILNNSKLTEFQACKFLHQLLDAIEYIHSLGVVHRDLKPENILLDYKFNIKLIDFGLSNIYSKDQMLRTACGSPCYAPPQMLSGQPYNGLKADIWSIGVVLYAMCFGYLPFDHQNVKQLYQSIREGKYDIPDHASKQLRSVLSVILQVDWQKRATIDQIRCHGFCKFSPLRLTPGIIVGLSDIPYEQEIEDEIAGQIYANKNLNQEEKEQLKKKLKYSIKFNKHNQLSASYYLLLHRNLKLQNQTLSNYYIKKNNLVNRYSLAEKVKLSYDKRLKEKIERNSRIIQSTNKKNNQSRNSKIPHTNNRSSYSKTNTKNTIEVVELYDRSKENLSNERRMKTTNTKREKGSEQSKTDRIFKKTRLNFNQIQLQQKKLPNSTSQKLKESKSYINHTKTNQKPRNKSFTATKPHYQVKPKSSSKKLRKSPLKDVSQNKIRDISEKKRSKSQNAFSTKNLNQRTEKMTYKNKKLQRKSNIKNNEKSGHISNDKRIQKVVFKTPLVQRSRS